MARFSFRLQALLNWKKNLEEISQMQLAERRRALAVCEKKIEGLIEERAFQDGVWKKKAEIGVSGSDCLAHADFSESGYRQLLSRQEEKQGLAFRVEAEQQNLLCLRKQRKMFERLRVRQMKRFSDATERLERKIEDEIAVMRFQRSKE
jgi:flagellar protein FliJ